MDLNENELDMTLMILDKVFIAMQYDEDMNCYTDHGNIVIGMELEELKALSNLINKLKSF